MANMIEGSPIWDRDQGPIRSYQFADGVTIHDMATRTAVFKIEDEDGGAIATLPGVIVGVKANGTVDAYMRGRETDYYGLGKDLIIRGEIWCAVQSDGYTPATNLLVNGSFDTGSAVADSWTQGGALVDMVYQVRDDDPAPPVIFGKCQRSYAPVGGTTTAYLSQNPAGAVVAGDWFSGGVWYRAKLDTGANIAGSEHYMTILGGANALKTNLPVGDTDWTWIYAEKWATEPAANSSFSLVNLDAKGYEIRYDEAFLFKGRWKRVTLDPVRVPVRPRTVVSKIADPIGTGKNHVAGFGGFEVDSNADGVADVWARFGTTNTFSMERDPDHLNSLFGSMGAQKIVLAGSASDRIVAILRGKFKATEQWRFQIYYKNSGALGGSPANGDFGLVLHTEEFDGPYESSLLTGANFSLGSVAAYTAKSRELVLAYDHSALVIEINLKTATGGTLWLDDTLLWCNG